MNRFSGILKENSINYSESKEPLIPSKLKIKPEKIGIEKVSMHDRYLNKQKMEGNSDFTSKPVNNNKILPSQNVADKNLVEDFQKAGILLNIDEEMRLFNESMKITRKFSDLPNIPVQKSLNLNEKVKKSESQISNFDAIDEILKNESTIHKKSSKFIVNRDKNKISPKISISKIVEPKELDKLLPYDTEKSLGLDSLKEGNLLNVEEEMHLFNESMKISPVISDYSPKSTKNSFKIEKNIQKQELPLSVFNSIDEKIEKLEKLNSNGKIKNESKYEKSPLNLTPNFKGNGVKRNLYDESNIYPGLMKVTSTPDDQDDLIELKRKGRKLSSSSPYSKICDKNALLSPPPLRKMIKISPISKKPQYPSKLFHSSNVNLNLGNKKSSFEIKRKLSHSNNLKFKKI